MKVTNLEVLRVVKAVTSCTYSREKITVYEKDCTVISVMCNCYKVVMIVFLLFPTTNKKWTENRTILRIICYLLILLNNSSSGCIMSYWILWKSSGYLDFSSAISFDFHFHWYYYDLDICRGSCIYSGNTQ